MARAVAEGLAEPSPSRTPRAAASTSAVATPGRRRDRRLLRVGRRRSRAASADGGPDATRPRQVHAVSVDAAKVQHHQVAPGEPRGRPRGSAAGPRSAPTRQSYQKLDGSNPVRRMPDSMRAATSTSVSPARISASTPSSTATAAARRSRAASPARLVLSPGRSRRRPPWARAPRPPPRARRFSSHRRRLTVRCAASNPTRPRPACQTF